MSNDVMQALGRIEGIVVEIKEAAKEHRDDDKRRFTEVFERLDEHSEDINKAKGAKGALLWVASGVAALASAAVAYAGKVIGLH